MSFGYSVGDFLAVAQIAYQVYRDARKSTAEFQALAKDVMSLHDVLEDTAETQKLFILTTKQQERSRQLAKNISEVLADFDGILVKYKSLGTDKQRTRDKLQWDKDVSDGLRSRIQLQLGVLNQFCSNLQSTNVNRLIEDKFAQLISEYRKGKRESSTSAKSARDGDEKAWNALMKDIGRQLQDLGISEAAVRENSEQILELIVKAVNRGDFEEDPVELETELSPSTDSTALISKDETIILPKEEEAVVEPGDSSSRREVGDGQNITGLQTLNMDQLALTQGTGTTADVTASPWIDKGAVLVLDSEQNALYEYSTTFWDETLATTSESNKPHLLPPLMRIMHSLTALDSTDNLESLLVSNEEAFGPDDSITLRVVLKLADLFFNKGDMGMAQRYYTRIRNSAMAYLEESKTSTVELHKPISLACYQHIFTCLGYIAYTQENLDEAEDCYKLAFNFRKVIPSAQIDERFVNLVQFDRPIWFNTLGTKEFQKAWRKSIESPFREKEATLEELDPVNAAILLNIARILRVKLELSRTTTFTEQRVPEDKHHASDEHSQVVSEILYHHIRLCNILFRYMTRPKDELSSLNVSGWIAILAASNYITIWARLPTELWPGFDGVSRLYPIVRSCQSLLGPTSNLSVHFKISLGRLMFGRELSLRDGLRFVGGSMEYTLGGYKWLHDGLSAATDKYISSRLDDVFLLYSIQQAASHSFFFKGEDPHFYLSFLYKWYSQGVLKMSKAYLYVFLSWKVQSEAREPALDALSLLIHHINDMSLVYPLCLFITACFQHQQGDYKQADSNFRRAAELIAADPKRGRVERAVAPLWISLFCAELFTNDGNSGQLSSSDSISTSLAGFLNLGQTNQWLVGTDKSMQHNTPPGKYYLSSGNDKGIIYNESSPSLPKMSPFSVLRDSFRFQVKLDDAYSQWGNGLPFSINTRTWIWWDPKPSDAQIFYQRDWTTNALCPDIAAYQATNPENKDDPNGDGKFQVTARGISLSALWKLDYSTKSPVSNLISTLRQILFDHALMVTENRSWIRASFFVPTTIWNLYHLGIDISFFSGPLGMFSGCSFRKLTSGPELNFEFKDSFTKFITQLKDELDTALNSKQPLKLSKIEWKTELLESS